MHSVTYKRKNLIDIGYKQTEGISYTDAQWVFLPMSTVKTFYYCPYMLYNYLIGREGQTMAAIVLSLMYAAMLFPVGVEHFFILGVVIGFSSFVPYIGFYSATAITLCSVYSQMHDVKKVIITLAILLGGQVIDGGFITPKIVGSRLGVHPLWVIFGVLVSMPLFGVFGILLALPMVGICNVVIQYMMDKYKHSDYYRQ